ANFTPERFLENMAQCDVFVGLKRKTLVGTVSLGGDKLHALFVEPSWQGQGIGRCLVDHLEAHAAARGIRLLRVSSSITACAFFEKLGYHLLAFEPHRDGSTFLMSKRLGRSP
ncbi:MAG: GNAT family N-acetyltransferase, partial [Hyphomicrobiaceae bacterium]|nr:GNAT family N-acetyltransferase [Hyphomicrobiaceae bacterium]